MSQEHYELRIDGPLLREQRALLTILADDARHGRQIHLGPEHAALLDGIVEMTDAIADQAHDRHGIDCLMPEADDGWSATRRIHKENLMPRSQTAKLYVEVKYNPEVTDAESIASALDDLLKIALSTPDLLDEYGNPSVGEFYAVGKSSTRHVGLVTITDPDSQAPVALEVRKTEGGYLVGIDASYLEQDAGPVYDPCNFGVELEIPDDES